MRLSKSRFRPRVERLESREVPAIVNWDGGPTGNGTNWLNPTNWQNDTLPGPNDTAIIANSGDNPIIYVDGTTSINGVNTSRPLELLGGSLSLGSAASQFATLSFLGGAINTGSGNVLFGPVNLTSGTLTLGPGISQFGTVNLNGGTLDFADGATVDLATFSGTGTLTIPAGRTVTFGNQATAPTIVNTPTNILGTLRIRRQTTFNGQVTTAVGSTIRHDSGSVAANSLVIFSSSFTLNGTLQLVSNTPSIFDAKTRMNLRGMTIAPSGRMESSFISGSGFSLSSSNSFVNQGVISVPAPGALYWTLETGSTVQNTGTIELIGTSGLSVSGPGIFRSSGIISISPASQWIHAAPFVHQGQIGGGGTLNLATTTTLEANLTNDEDLNLILSGTVNGPGTLTNAPGRFLEMNAVTMNAPLMNQGYILLSRTNRFNGPVQTAHDTLIQVRSSPQTGVGSLTTSAFRNFGRIVLDPATSIGSTGFAVTSGDMVNEASGRIEIGNSAPLPNSATINLSSSSSLTNFGTLLLTGINLNLGGGSFSNPGTILDYFHNDLILTSSFVSLNGGSLSGGSYNLGGLLRLNAGLGITRLSTNLTLNSMAAGITSGGGNALLNLQTINPNSSLTLVGDKLLTFNNNVTNNGTIEVGGGCALTMTGGLNNNGLLNGNGAVIGTVTGAGTIAPGLALPGRLTIQSPLTLAGILQCRLNGFDVGGEYDQLRVVGSVSLGGALTLLVGFTPPSDTVFRILDNDGTDPIVGTFAALPEGETINVGGQAFRISYVGGTGNDVTLTKLGAPSIPAVVVGDGTAQRSRIAQLKVVFDQIVGYVGDPAAAYTLQKIVGGVPSGLVGLSVNTVTVGGHSEATISFSSDTTFGSLNDGRYRLTVIANQITAGGSNLPADSVTDFHRYYGDINGDARIDITDFGFFSSAYLNPANFNASLDFNNDGRIDIADFGQFSARFFTTLP